MKPDKKHIITSLLSGMYLMKRKNHANVQGYKLYSGNMVPEHFIRERLFNSLDSFPDLSIFKTDSKQRITLNLSNVRRLHGNHWIKKIYKKHKRK